MGYQSSLVLTSALILSCVASSTRAQGTSAQQGGAKVVAVFDPEHAPATYLIEDLDGDGRAEFVFVSDGGVVEIRAVDASKAAFVARKKGTLTLPYPEHSMLACADVLGGPKLELIAATPKGVFAWSLTDAGVFSGEPVRLTTRRKGRQRIRLGKPRFVSFVTDVDQDGQPDLVLPVGDSCELWRNLRGGESDRSFELVQTIALDSSRSRAVNGRFLSSSLSNRIEIAHLETEDINGDGRPDLIVQEDLGTAFYLQNAEGRFAADPIRVDLSIFVDTTPAASVALGKTLAGTDTQHMQKGDLDGDGIPDYVIAHRRKVWVFLGTKAGPQFEKPDYRMRVAEDISGLALLQLDDDGLSDLLVFKVVVPSAGELVMALVSSLDIQITAIGYAAGSGGKFEKSPRWRRELTLEIPPILSLMSRAEELMKRVEEIIAKVRKVAGGEFASPDEPSLSVLNEEATGVELWRNRSLPESRKEHLEKRFRELLFVDANPVFTIDRLLDLMELAFDERSDAITGGDGADGRFEIENAELLVVRDLLAADVLGNGRDALILVTESKEKAQQITITVLSWE